jgi:hypothetical protein
MQPAIALYLEGGKAVLSQLVSSAPTFEPVPNGLTGCVAMVTGATSGIGVFPDIPDRGFCSRI